MTERQKEAIEAVRLALMRCEQEGLTVGLGRINGETLITLPDARYTSGEGVGSLRAADHA